LSSKSNEIHHFQVNSLNSLLTLSNSFMEQSAADTSKWSEILSKACDDLHQKLRQHKEKLSQVNQEIESQMQQYMTEVIGFGDEQRKKLKDLNNLAREQFKVQSDSMQNQKSFIQQLQKNQDELAQKIKGQIFKEVTELLNKQFEIQQTSLRDSLQSFESDLENQIQGVEEFSSEFSNKMVETDNSIPIFTQNFGRQVQENKPVVSLHPSITLTEGIQEELTSLQSREVEKIGTKEAILSQHTATLQQTIREGIAGSQTLNIQFGEQFQKGQNELVANEKEVLQHVANMEREFSSAITSVEGRVTTCQSDLKAHGQNEADSITMIQTTTSTFSKDQYQKYVATSFTPAKKEYIYPKSWKRTRAYEEIIQEMNQTLQSDKSSNNGFPDSQLDQIHSPALSTPTSVASSTVSSPNTSANSPIIDFNPSSTENMDFLMQTNKENEFLKTRIQTGKGNKKHSGGQRIPLSLKN